MQQSIDADYTAADYTMVTILRLLARDCHNIAL